MNTPWVTLGMAITLAGYDAAAAAATASARVSQTQGRVLVTQTTAAVPARTDMPLSAGNRVEVLGGAAATIMYPDGCSVAVSANSTLTIGSANQCSTGQAQVETTRVATTADPAKRTRPPGSPLPADGSNLSR